MARTDFPNCIIPAINFKGGTGKTTVTIALAEGLCRKLRKRILIIDCDFQCSASIALLGRQTLNNLIDLNATLDGQLEALVTGNDGPRLHDAVVQARHCVKEASELMFLLPGNPDMPRRERQILASFLPGRDIHSAYQCASTKIAELYRSLLRDFDLILIDCPPGLTLFSEAAIRAADGLIIPTLPNEISFAAIDHLRREIGRARPDRTLEDLLVGTVISKLCERTGSEHHRYQSASIERLLDRVAPRFRMLKPYLPYCRELEGTTWRNDEAEPVDFAHRYGRSSEKIEQLTQALADRCRALLKSNRPKARSVQATHECLTS
jgi:cellulose biosynthesis protein BcsQ